MPPISVNVCIACVQLLFVRSLFEIAHCVGSFILREQNNTDQVQTQAYLDVPKDVNLCSKCSNKTFFHGILAARKLSIVFLSLQFVGDQNAVKARYTERLLRRSSNSTASLERRVKNVFMYCVAFSFVLCVNPTK